MPRLLPLLLLVAARAPCALGKTQPFPCEAVLPAISSPADISELHPGHVSVVMAMGDSITAAFAARNSIADPGELPLEYRADSFSGGQGSDAFWTLPYFMRHYNASLTGYSRMMTLPQLPETGYTEADVDFLNTALSSAKSQDLMVQIDELEKQSARVPEFDARWKVLTILIGANDICGGFRPCSGRPGDAEAVAEEFAQNLDAALAAVERRFSRVFVNVVSIFSISSVRRVTASHSGILPCHFEARLVDECDCIDHPLDGQNVTAKQLANLDYTTSLVNARIRSLAAKYNHARTDFAVVAHFNWEGQDIPNFKFLSKLDCFHPSSFAHRAMAVLIWNSMFDANKHVQPIDSSAAPICPCSMAASLLAGMGASF